MFDDKFDLYKPYLVVLYLRMSDPGQNPRSPDQQQTVIQDRIRSMNLPWKTVKIYRDDGISGRYILKRPAYQEMLRDIETGAVQADAILVDTTERFGRVDDLQSIRKRLWTRNGVLLLTAESNFADPMTPVGKAYSAFEAMRITEEGRIKAHQVVRGKRDMATRKFWPGGKRPFGLQFLPIIEQVEGHAILEGHRLEPLLAEAAVISLAYSTALDAGLGQNRLAKYLTAHPDVPAEFKPFHPTTVGRWLKNPIYCGHLTWQVHVTDVIYDAHVIKRNEPDRILHVPDFCEPIVSREVWLAVQELREKRAEVIFRARESSRQDDAKQLKAPAPGMALKYLLTGLARCGVCRRSLRPTSTKSTNANGEIVQYVYYKCPGYIDGLCDNSVSVPEGWLRKTVVDTLRARLFPEPSI